MLASVDDALAALQRASRIRESGQHGLFGGGSATPAPAPFELRDAAPWAKKSGSRASMRCWIYVRAIRWKNMRRGSQSGKCEPGQVKARERQRNRRGRVDVGTRPMRSKRRALGISHSGHDWDQELLAFPKALRG